MTARPGTVVPVGSNGEILPPQKRPARFEKGNKLAVGHGPPSPRAKILTQILISQLNEIDPGESKAKMHKLIEQLIRLALGYDIREKTKKGTKVIHVEGDLTAIRDIFDRIEGRPVSIAQDESGGGKITIIFEAADAAL